MLLSRGVLLGRRIPALKLGGSGGGRCHCRGVVAVTRVCNRHNMTGGVGGKHPKAYSKGQYKFVDKVSIVATGGKGGDGCVSLEGESPTNKRPSGGSGGAGGNVYAIADSTLETLQSKIHHFNAQPGAPGGGSGKKGRTGKNSYVRVPCGTLVSEVVKDEMDHAFHPWSLANGIECGGGKAMARGGGEEEGFDGEEEDWGFDDDDLQGKDDTQGEERYVVDLEQEGDEVLLATGGKPGLGNLHLASRMVGSKTPGQRGETRHYRFELRTIADIGLVGYPNAGKSTLLGCITSAKPKVAMYPFTTLSPVVGQVEYSDTIRLRVADIPGLIDGAHRNRGLGHEFLRHVARTRALIFVVDAAGSEGRDPVEDFNSLKEELRLYDGELAEKPAFVVANKTDLPETEKHLQRLRDAADPFPVVPVSALESRGLVDVVVTMRELLDASLHNPDAAVLGPDGGDGDRTEDEERADRMESIAASAARKRRGNNSAMAA